MISSKKTKCSNTIYLNNSLKKKVNKPNTSVKKQVSAPTKSTLKSCTKEQSICSKEKSCGNIILQKPDKCNQNKMHLELVNLLRNNRPASCPSSSKDTFDNHFIDRGEYVAKNDHLVVETQLKELQERYNDVMIELEKSKNTVESLLEKLNKDKDDKECQTIGVRLEQLEESLLNMSSENNSLDIKLKEMSSEKNSLDLKLKKMSSENNSLDLKLKEMSSENNSLDLKLKKMSSENNSMDLKLEKVTSEKDSLHSQLQSSNICIENLKHNLEVTNHELKTVSDQNVLLSSKIETLIKTVEDSEKNDSAKTKRIENLCAEKNKFKYSLNDVSRERDEAREELIELTNKLTKTTEKYLQLKSETDAKRASVVERSMYLSDQTDEINKKTKRISDLEEIISKHEDLIENYTRENRDQNNMIVNLEANVIELKNELDSWQTRAECWINTFVRDKYDSKIDDLQREIYRLIAENKKLMRTYENCVREKSERMSEKDEIVKIKQSIIDQQEEIVKLMRSIHSNQTTNDNERVKRLIENVLLKYDETMRKMRNTEELTIENGQLRATVNEYQLRLNTDLYKQL